MNQKIWNLYKQTEGRFVKVFVLFEHDLIVNHHEYKKYREQYQKSEYYLSYN